MCGSSCTRPYSDLAELTSRVIANIVSIQDVKHIFKNNDEILVRI